MTLIGIEFATNRYNIKDVGLWKAWTHFAPQFADTTAEFF
jgi:hypothetical protein